MKSTLIKWISLGSILFFPIFMAGCYTQLATYSSTEESYTSSRSNETASQSSYGEENTQSETVPTDSEYYPANQEEQQEYDQGEDNGTTNIYNFYSPIYPYGEPYWPYSWWGNPWYYDYPPYDGFYFSVSFGAPYYYDPFLWDWRTRWYDGFGWYNPYRYRYSVWYREWRYGYDPYNWWWYDSYTYERVKMKRRQFDRREGLERGGVLGGPVAVGSAMGGASSATGLRKVSHIPNRNRPGLNENPARVPKRKIQTDRTDDVIHVNKGTRSEGIIPSRIRKATRTPRTEGLVVRHPKRVRKVKQNAETRIRYTPSARHNDRLRKIRKSRVQQTRTSTTPRIYSTRKRHSEYRSEPKIHSRRVRSVPRKSTRVRYMPPQRTYHPIIRHRSAPSRSYSPPPRTSQPAVRTPSSSSSSTKSRSRRERK